MRHFHLEGQKPPSLMSHFDTHTNNYFTHHSIIHNIYSFIRSIVSAHRRRLITIMYSRLAFFGCLLSHAAAFMPQGGASARSMSVLHQADAASWTGEVVSNSGGMIQGCQMTQLEGSTTEWSIQIDGYVYANVCFLEQFVLCAGQSSVFRVENLTYFLFFYMYASLRILTNQLTHILYRTIN
jgi:hypothetical protein